MPVPDLLSKTWQRAGRHCCLLPVCWRSLLTAGWLLLTAMPVQSEALPPYQQLPALNQQSSGDGRGALLLLFAPDCRYCKQQARLMAQLKALCPELQMGLIGVQANRAELQQEVRQLQTPLPAFMASPAFLRAIDGVQAIPTSLIIDSDGQLLHKQRGMLGAVALQQLSNQLLAPNCQVMLD